LILDIAFPHGAIEDDRSIYLVIHGINGHSNEGYVLDFANQQVAEGNVVAVMVTRGLMDSPVLGQNLAHFARTSDLAVTSKALKSAIRKMKGRSMTHSDDSITPMLTGVGFSMGAITLANYVARSGQDCALDAAIGFSGALDTREQVSFKRSASLWQPFIAKAMRDTMVNKYMKQIENKFDRDQYNEMMRAESLVDLDRSFFAPYNDYNSLYDYYSNT
jgi:predicted alpha/beta-fold hydrolase